MQVPGFVASRSISGTRGAYRTSGRTSIAADHVVVPQWKGNILCGACTCRTVGGCGVGPFNPGWQNCLELDTKGSLDPRDWSLDVVSQPCFGATSGALRG